MAAVAPRPKRLSIRFQEADAEALPFADGHFDVVLSSFGVMFTPNHARAAGELLRVCRREGRIGLANWTPRGFIGQLFVVVGRHVPPPAGAHAAFALGNGRSPRSPVRRLSVGHPHDVIATSCSGIVRPQHWIDVFRTWYGPVHKAFAGLPAEAQGRLEQDLIALIADFNQSGDSTVVVPGEYAEVVVVKK